MSLQEVNVQKIARFWHADQMYGEDPYMKHLDDVVAVIKEFMGRYELCMTYDQLAAVGMLHDILEDTEITMEILIESLKHVGFKILPMVKAIKTLSNNSQSKFKHDIAGMSKYHVYNEIAKSTDATFIKLADRIANCESGAKNDKYRKEMPMFYSLLYKEEGQFNNMWLRLFKALEK